MKFLKCDAFFPSRKYIQINDLVIDNFDMLSDADLSRSTKTETQEYSYGHGSYVDYKEPQQFVKEQQLSMSISVDYKKFRRDQRQFFKDFMMMNILKPGRLWAIEGNQLLWAYAHVVDFGEPYTREKFKLDVELEIVLPEGVWHKADPRKVFLQPYIACEFIDCLGFQELDCKDCCLDCMDREDTCLRCQCQCDDLTIENSLCGFDKIALNDFFNKCGDTYQIVYNCEAGKKLWGEKKMLGEKICKKETCKSLIAGQFYSHTVLNTDRITVTIIGEVTDPTIEINGNKMQILGEYTGSLTLTQSGDMYFQSDPCCQKESIDINKLVIPKKSSFGFFVHQGMNSVVIETNNCCSMVCAFIKVDNITA